MYAHSFLDLSEAGFLMTDLAAKLGGWCGSYQGVKWQQATRDAKSVSTQLLWVPAEMKRNSSSRITKSVLFVSGKLLFAH